MNVSISTTLSASGTTTRKRTHWRAGGRVSTAPRDVVRRAPPLDEAYVERALCGDRACARRLCDELRPTLKSAVRRVLFTPRGMMCRTELDAEDMVQEIFAGLF